MPVYKHIENGRALRLASPALYALVNGTLSPLYVIALTCSSALYRLGADIVKQLLAFCFRETLSQPGYLYPFAQIAVISGIPDVRYQAGASGKKVQIARSLTLRVRGDTRRQILAVLHQVGDLMSDHICAATACQPDCATAWIVVCAPGCPAEPDRFQLGEEPGYDIYPGPQSWRALESFRQLSRVPDFGHYLNPRR